MLEWVHFSEANVVGLHAKVSQTWKPSWSKFLIWCVCYMTQLTGLEKTHKTFARARPLLHRDLCQRCFYSFGGPCSSG